MTGYGNYPVSPDSGAPYGASNGGDQGVPAMFTVNGKKVMVMMVDDNDAAFAALFPSKSVGRPPSGKLSVSPAGLLAIDGPTHRDVDQPRACIPAGTPAGRGVCVDEGLLQIACPNMIVAQGDACRSDQFCCFVD